MENQGKENTILRAYNEYIVKERELSQQDGGESKKAFLDSVKDFQLLFMAQFVMDLFISTFTSKLSY